jgi:membrane protease YdiL (CAAX protease family)
METQVPDADPSTGNGTRIAIADEWFRLLAGLAIAFALFETTARILGSDRGQAGIVVAALVLAALAGAERWLFGTPARTIPRSLGLGRPDVRGIAAAAGVSALLLIVIAAIFALRGEYPGMTPGWLYLVPGLLAQAGLAEETLFRGYLFGHLYAGRTFWRAACLSMLPFLGVHLFLFATLPWPIALASVLLAAAMSFPLAHLYVIGGHTIWAPALLHFVAQGTLKVLALPPEATTQTAALWMVACAALPLLVFMVPRQQDGGTVGSHLS